MICFRRINKQVNKMKKTSIILYTLTSIFAASAFAHNNNQELEYYVGAQYNVPAKIYTDLAGKSSDMKQSIPNFDLKVGTKLGENFRIEFAPGYRAFKYNTTLITSGYAENIKINRLDLYKLMFNGYIDGPKFADVFTPYVMGGIGYAHINKRNLSSTFVDSADVSSTSISGNNFAWQSGVGVNTVLTKSMSMDIGVVYASYGKVKFADPSVTASEISKTKLSDIEAFVGFRYHF
jgi:opacity protein-like surface antigen